MAKPPKGTKPSLRLLLDEGVLESVRRAFEQHGHEVIRSWDVTPRGSEDPVVCTAALANDAILVALDKDMKAIARALGIGFERYKRLSLIKLTCPEPSAADRVAGAMSLLEHEWAISEGKAARRLFIEIGAGYIRTLR